MMRSEEGQPHYLEVDGAAVFAVLHEPSAGQRSTAVVMVAPFGWEESCSYRGRRAWATALADEGFAVLRFDLPGTGDSAGGPRDAGLVDAWLRAIKSAAVHLRESTGVTRVAAIGIGLGGLLACAASAAGAQLDELVLWGVPARGRAVVRELTAFARLEASQRTNASNVPGGPLVVNGFLMSAETAAALGALNVQTTPPFGVRRALLLDRDRMPVDEALQATLVSGGADVTVGVGRGYGTFMAEPQLSVPPWDVMASVSAWLAADLGTDRTRPPARELRTEASVMVGGVAVRQRLMTFDLPGGPAFGVLTEPLGVAVGLCAVLLNAGGIRRIGPNRMWVGLARRWASLGVPTLRLDLASIGDAGGPDCFPLLDEQLYEPRYGQQVQEVFDALAGAGLAPQFFLAGLCSGAYWSFQVGQADHRVAGIAMVNPAALVYDAFQWTVRRSRFVGRLLNPPTARRVLRGEIPLADVQLVVGAVMRRALAAPSRLRSRVAARRLSRRVGGDELDHELDRLRDAGSHALLVLSAEEPLRGELERDGRFDQLDRWPNLDLRLLDGTDATHMLQPLALQEQAQTLLDAALDALLV